MSERHKDLDDSEVVAFGPFYSYIVTIDGISLASGPTVRNLGVISDQDLSN